MASRSHALPRALALLTLGALAVHWLRYLLSYGQSAGDQLNQQGHGYLNELLPGIVALCVALLVASAALRVLTKGARRVGAAPCGTTLVFACCLLAIYGTQEATEGVLASGHASGLGAVTADSGWVAVPAALLVGAILSLFERLLVRAEDRLVALLPVPAARARSQADPLPPRTPFVFSRAARPLAFGLARRPPPPLPSI